LFTLTVVDSAADKKEGLRKKVKEYMNRAEILQKSVEEQKACKLLSVSSHLVLSQRKLI